MMFLMIIAQVTLSLLILLHARLYLRMMNKSYMILHHMYMTQIVIIVDHAQYGETELPQLG